MTGRPLAGCLVLDLGIITAGAATSAILADLGARVLKVESATYPDPFRNWTAVANRDPGEIAPVFTFTNRNKFGLGLDLKTELGRGDFLNLVGQADIVVENFRRGVLAGLGLGFAILAARNPRLILASISSQGETGPDRDTTSFGSTLEATGGLAAITGYDGDAPTISSRQLNYPDQIVSIFAAGAIMSALLARHSTGRGAHLEISQRDLTSFLVGEYVAAASVSPPLPGTALRRGNRDPGGGFQGCFRARDGRWIALTAASDETLKGLANLLESPPDHKSIGSAIAAHCAKREPSDLVRALEGTGASAAIVASGAEMLEALKHTSSALARDPEGNVVKGFPFQNRAAPYRIERRAPRLGEHTEQILAEFRGTTDAPPDR